MLVVRRSGLAIGPVDEPPQHPSDGMYVQRLCLGWHDDRRNAPTRVATLLLQV